MRNDGIGHCLKKFVSIDGKIISEEELKEKKWEKILTRNFGGYPLFQRLNEETGENEVVGWYPIIKPKEEHETEESPSTWGKIFLHYAEKLC